MLFIISIGESEPEIMKTLLGAKNPIKSVDIGKEIAGVQPEKDHNRDVSHAAHGKGSGGRKAGRRFAAFGLTHFAAAFADFSLPNISCDVN